MLYVIAAATTTGRNSVFQFDEIPFALFAFFYALALSGYTEGSRARKSMAIWGDMCQYIYYMSGFMNRKRVILLKWGKSMAIWKGDSTEMGKSPCKFFPRTLRPHAKQKHTSLAKSKRKLSEDN